MLFGNMLNLDKGIFIPKSERSSSLKPLSRYMSDLLAIQDNLLKASAEDYTEFCECVVIIRGENEKIVKDNNDPVFEISEEIGRAHV